MRRGLLCGMDRLLPAARKERRVGAEKHAVRPDDRDDLAETASSVRPGWYFIHPFELEVSRWMFGHCSAAMSSFAKHAGAEMRNDDRDGGKRAAVAASASGSPSRKSNGDGRPSFFLIPTVSTPQCAKTTASADAAAANTSRTRSSSSR